MICEECERLGGMDSFEAEFRLSVISPPEAASENPPMQLCHLHAQQGAEAYIGYGWGVLALRLHELRGGDDGEDN